jgi:hypothetical protein
MPEDKGRNESDGDRNDGGSEGEERRQFDEDVSGADQSFISQPPGNGSDGGNGDGDGGDSGGSEE